MTCPVGSEHPEPDNLTVCSRCSTQTHRHLSFLADNVTVLPLEVEVTSSTTRTTPGSSAPLRIAALSFLAQGGLVSLLTEWVQVLADHDRCTPPSYRLATGPKVTAQLRLLKTHQDWILAQETMAAPFVTEIDGAAASLANLLDPDRTWLPLPGRWTCPVEDPEEGPCGGLLRQHKGKWLVRCPTCRTLWEGDAELERLGRLLGCDLEVTVAQAAVLASVSERTIYLWVKAGTLPTTKQGGHLMIDRRDLALTLATRDVGP